ncbi:MAG: cupin domain-containing protein [Fretibacterium sp.]|nr:cupin domain-containing protein [Fretibacterium sp.]
MTFQRGELFSSIAFGEGDRRKDEFVSILASGGGTRVERIVSEGHASSEGFWYDQDEWEWVAVLQGSAELEFEGRDRVELSAGDWVLIPAHERHRVIRTSAEPQCVWLAVFGQRLVPEQGEAPCEGKNKEVS